MDNIGNNTNKNNSIKNNSIKNNSIKNNSIKNNSIKNNSIKNNSIKNNSIKNNKINIVNNNNEQGWIMAYMVVVLPIFLLLLAIAVDYGMAVNTKVRLQTAVDAAALAAASAYDEEVTYTEVTELDPNTGLPISVDQVPTEVKRTINLTEANKVANEVFNKNIENLQRIVINKFDLQKVTDTEVSIEVQASVETFLLGKIQTLWQGSNPARFLTISVKGHGAVKQW